MASALTDNYRRQPVEWEYGEGYAKEIKIRKGILALLVAPDGLGIIALLAAIVIYLFLK